MSDSGSARLSSVPISNSTATTASPNSKATHGLRRTAWTLAKMPGTTSSRAVPERIRDWVTTETRVVLVIAVTKISE